MNLTLPHCKKKCEKCVVGDEVFEAQYASPAMGFPVFHLPSKDTALDIILSKSYIPKIHIK